MLIGHLQNSAYLPREGDFARMDIFVEFQNSLVYAGLEISYGIKFWPVLVGLRNFGVVL